MPLRSAMEQPRQLRKELALDSKKQSQVAPAAGAAETRGQEATAPQIIECRKKNSSGESVITHRYRKGRLLGKGGFAHCFKVTCLDTARIYAMKIVPKSTLVKSRARQKLQTEIKIHRTLQHPRVVRFEMFFEDRENVYILLELCTNHSLAELLRKTKRFTEDECRRYMLQILEATSYLHRHRIIHRDLKLGNVFLDRDWNIKMGDFGLATKLVQDSERKRTICGTPNYIAPEILEGTAGHSYQVDLWSAGVILYTMLVGRPPYESTDVKSTYRRILANVYAFPDSVPVSDSAKDLVGRLLQVKPELRPSLDEILNHSFLRNGGPRQRFSTTHGLRGSSSSVASTTAVTGSASAGASGSCGGAVGGTGVYSGGHGGQKGTPEQGAAAGYVRPPLKTRSANVDAEGDAVVADGARGAKALRGGGGGGGGGSATTAQAAGSGGTSDGGRDTLGRHGPIGTKRPSAHASRPGPPPPSSSSATATAFASGGGGAGGSGSGSSSGGAGSTTRSAVPRTGSSKGFTVYCDSKESTAGGGGAGPGGVGGRAAGAVAGAQQASKRASPGGASGRVRRETAGGSGSGGGVSVSGDGGGKSPGEDKENGLRRPFVAGGARVAVNGPVARRPLSRSASTVVCSGGGGVETRGGRARGAKGSAAAAAAVTGGEGRGAGFRRSASTVATAADGRMSAARSAAESAAVGAVGGGGRASGLGRLASGTAGTASPRVRIGASGRGVAAAAAPPPTTATYSPYRSPGLGASPAGVGVNARASAGGDGVTPRGTAQQRLDFGSTPRASRQRESARRGGGSGAVGRKGRPLRRPAGGGARGTPSPPSTARDLAGTAGEGKTAGSSSPPSSSSAAATGKAEAATAVAEPTPDDLERDTLENMHDFLTSSFAVADRGNAASAASSLPGGGRGKRPATALAAAAVETDAPSAPQVWVTRYVDYSIKYGLGFLLSDGSAGVYFNDATKVVLEPAGVSFDYIERARRSPPPPPLGDGVAGVGSAAAGAGIGAGAGAGGARSLEHPPRARHTLDNFPPTLQKKVTLLNHFRGYLHELVKKDEGEGGAVAGNAATAAVANASAAPAAGVGISGDGASAPRRGQAREPLTFLKKWLRTRNAILFRLSNRTVQVVFSDHTEILLSKEARVVTFVDKDGKRETSAFERVLQDQRTDIIKRVRYSKELIAQLLRRS